MEQVKKKGKIVTVYTQAEVLAAFELPRKAENPPEAHPGFKPGINMWHESMVFLPDALDAWVAVNQAKTHFRTADGSGHHVSVQDGEVTYWVEDEQESDRPEGRMSA